MDEQPQPIQSSPSPPDKLVPVALPQTRPEPWLRFPSLNGLTSCVTSAAYPLLISSDDDPPEEPPQIPENGGDESTPLADLPETDEKTPSGEASAPPFNPSGYQRRAPHDRLTRILKFDVMLTIALDLAFFVMACVVANRVRMAEDRNAFVVVCIVLSIVTCVVNFMRVACAIAVLFAASRTGAGWPFWRMYNVYYLWTLVLSLAIFAVFGACVAAIKRDPEFRDSMVMLSVMNIAFRALFLLVFFAIPLYYTKWFRNALTMCTRIRSGPDMFN